MSGPGDRTNIIFGHGEGCPCVGCSQRRQMLDQMQREANAKATLFPYDSVETLTVDGRPPVEVTPVRHMHDHADLPLHPLDYSPPSAAQIEQMRGVVEGLKLAWNAIERHCPASAERTLALRAIQEARSRANEAILGITIPRGGSRP